MTATALQRRRAAPGIRIAAHAVLDDGDVAACWEMYRAAFEPLRTRAATRHAMYADEFAAAMRDPRLEKRVGYDRAGQPIGMALLTRDLRAIPWISPEFFEHRHPDEAARGAVVYIGFILVHPDLQGGLLFHKLIKPIAQEVAAERGVVAFDMCTFNADVIRLPDAILRAIRRYTAAADQVEDVQTFYALRLSQKDG